MWLKTNTITIVIAILLLSSCMLLMKPVGASLYTNNDYIATKLNVTSPSSSTFYVNTMPLSFATNWTTTSPISWMYMQISYSIDDGPKIQTTGGGSLMFSRPELITYSDSIVEISNLTDGVHALSVFIDGNYNVDNDFVFAYNRSFSPIYFYVNYNPTTPTPASPTPSTTSTPTPTQVVSPTPTATPTVPEISWLVVVPLLLSVFAVVFVVRRRMAAYA
jgi:hypothetical protein